MKTDVHKLALCAVLAAMALALSYMENLLPTALLVPLPGFKLGLANIVTVFALYYLGAAPAMAILVARCLLGAMFAGNVPALFFSLMGGVLAMLIVVSVFTGALTGFVAAVLFSAMEKAKIAPGS